VNAADELRTHFDLYLAEIRRCLEGRCYWALMHILLALPDVCASLEHPGRGRARYKKWCEAYLPRNSTVSAEDRYQMRNALLHAGCTEVDGKTSFSYFSVMVPRTFTVDLHETRSSDPEILNVDPEKMATETVSALDKWFESLQQDQTRISRVRNNIGHLASVKDKHVHVEGPNGVAVEFGLALSST